MKKFYLAALFILISGILFAQQNIPPKYALVIGNGAYTGLSRLTNPVNDANDVTAALQGLGFTVDKVLNGSLDQMEGAVMRLKNRLSVSGESYGFFFYAGHGVQSNGENYLIPADANIPGENSLKNRAISVQWVLDELNDARNRLNVVVLDACRDNPFGWARSGSRGLALVGHQPADSIIVYATSAGQTASDGTGRNGLFTGQLLKNLKTPGLEVKEVFNRTGADVSEVSGRRQIPAVYNQFFGTAFLGAAAAATPAANTPAQPAPAGVSTAISIDVSTKEGGILYFQGNEIATLWDNDNHSIPIEKPGTYTVKMVSANGSVKTRSVTIASRGVTRIDFSSFGIGDTGPAGGIIFYDKGNDSDGWRYLEAAPFDLKGGADWGLQSSVSVAGTETRIGAGKRNTELIIAVFNQKGKRGTAAQLCGDFTLNGYDDWFLPSKDELNLMYQNLKQQGLGDFDNDWYWSSSEVTVTSTRAGGSNVRGGGTVQNSRAIRQDFGNGKQETYRMGSTEQVRAVRAF